MPLKTSRPKLPKQPTILGLGLILLLFLHACTSSIGETLQQKPGTVQEYCQTDTFHSKCLKNEVILMKSATYGRMRIGRCITADEVAEHGPEAEEDPRFLGCSKDVLAILDQKCSGRTECEVRVVDLSHRKIKPCLGGLNAHLEAAFDCITIADEERSCVVATSNKPSHIIRSSDSQIICGTKSQPWIVEAPVGQKINFILLDFNVPLSVDKTGKEDSVLCRNYGVIVDKPGKRNASICGEGQNREKQLFSSAANTVEIFFNLEYQEGKADDEMLFILKVEAIGCSDIIPPEDSWLKRNNDVIVIGCYSSRQTWQLSCERGKWTGVVGNCTQDILLPDSFLKPTVTTGLTSHGQVLAIVAISGFTVAISLTIVCVGAVCLRRFYTNKKKKKEHQTLGYQMINNSYRLQHHEHRSAVGLGSEFPANTDGSDGFVQQQQQPPMYCVYTGGSGSGHQINAVHDPILSSTQLV